MMIKSYELENRPVKFIVCQKNTLRLFQDTFFLLSRNALSSTLTYFSSVLHFIQKSLIWFVLKIKWLVSIWNVTLSWNGLKTHFQENLIKIVKTFLSSLFSFLLQMHFTNQFFLGSLRKFNVSFFRNTAAQLLLLLSSWKRNTKKVAIYKYLSAQSVLSCTQQFLVTWYFYSFLVAFYLFSCSKMMKSWIIDE